VEEHEPQHPLEAVVVERLLERPAEGAGAARESHLRVDLERLRLEALLRMDADDALEAHALEEHPVVRVSGWSGHRWSS